MLTAQRQEHLQTEYWVAWYRGLSFRRSSRSRGMSNNKNCTAFWAGEGDFIYPTLNPTVGPKGCYWKKCVARHAERLVLYVKIWDHPPKRFWDQTPIKIHEELSALQERRSRHQLSWQVGQRSICWRYTKIQLYWGVFGEFLFKGDRSLCVNLAFVFFCPLEMEWIRRKVCRQRGSFHRGQGSFTEQTHIFTKVRML